MLQNKKFGVISLGCDKNRVDSEKLIAILRERGCLLTNDLSEAEIVIVNTCAFLESARQESIETVLDCAALKGEKLQKIVVTGCLPEKFIGELFEPLTEADVFLGVKDYENTVAAIEESYRTGNRQNFVGTGVEKNRLERVVTTPEHYAYLKIADGCYNHCTYCLIPKIRGKYRSYPIEELVAEAEGLGQTQELIVVAQDTTRYGEDLYGENKFVELLQKLSAIETIETIRLLYCYPDAIDEKLIAELKNNPKILKYLDIPLQHSEDRILKLMNRKGKRDEYLSLIRRLREEIPEIAIRSTFICGFPSETEEEHERMIAFVNEAKLTSCGFFAYSREPDTAAARMKGQIHHATKKRRVAALYAAQSRVSETLLSALVGKTVEVLCDGIDYEKNCFVGRTYRNAPDIDGKVYFNAHEAEQGERYQVLITDYDCYDLYGKTEDYTL